MQLKGQAQSEYPTNRIESSRVKDMSQSSIALGNLRAVVIVIVVAFHSVLPYLASLPPDSYRFDTAPYQWQAFPIVDSQRWLGFDLFCAWQDISLMALMFFLSGLFVAPSLSRKGSRTFLSDRSLRLGIPFLFAVIALMPLAYYPAYRTTAIDPSVNAYWQHWLALPFWPCGPQWFLGLLLALNVLAASLHSYVPCWRKRLFRLAVFTTTNPLRFFAVLVAISSVAYVPLAMVFSPWAWSNFGPLGLQLSRPLLYLVFFFAGMAVGAQDIGRGLLASEGMLARYWAAWFIAAAAGFALWALPTSATLGGWDSAPPMLKLGSSLGFVVACAGGCLFLIAFCLRFARARTWAFSSLQVNAYGIFIVHYVFAIWLQYALLGFEAYAVVKAAIVFGGTLAASWAVAAAFHVLASGRHTAVESVR
jgi:glucans biosynthesis protein C